jgi:hypothetical protein
MLEVDDLRFRYCNFHIEVLSADWGTEFCCPKFFCRMGQALRCHRAKFRFGCEFEIWFWVYV